MPKWAASVREPLVAGVLAWSAEFLRDQDTAADELPICTAKATSDQLDKHIRGLIES